MVRLLDLDYVSYLHSQTIYHTVAYCMGEESPGTIIILNPKDPYVCVGYHQVLEREIDIEYCHKRGIPYLRREVGGGTVYLDKNQMFFQCIFPSKIAPMKVDNLYALFLEPGVNTYRALGVDARYQPASDIVVGEKKICGTGAGRIGDASVVVGNIMFDFDYGEMSRVFCLPSESFRDGVFKAMKRYVTTLRNELGYMPERENVKGILIKEFEKTLGLPLQKEGLTSDEKRMMPTIDKRFTDPAWLHETGGKVNDWVKITTDVKVMESTFGSPGGRVRIVLCLKNDIIDDMAISGEFSPQLQENITALEKHLVKHPVEPVSLLKTIQSFYASNGIQSAPIKPDDLVRAIMGEKN